MSIEQNRNTAVKLYERIGFYNKCYGYTFVLT